MWGCRGKGTRISIHALREEGDLIRAGVDIKTVSISIHALREEGDCSFTRTVYLI